MCVSNPDNKGMGGTNLVLRPCNQQKWQAFLAASSSHRQQAARDGAHHVGSDPQRQHRHRRRPVQLGERQVCRGRPPLHVCREGRPRPWPRPPADGSFRYRPLQ